MTTIKPSHFKSQPMGSILQKSEAETIASNIMRIRARLGDSWALSWADYKRERQKDGSFDMIEKPYFEEVIKLIPDALGAISFAPAWARDARKAQPENVKDHSPIGAYETPYKKEYKLKPTTPSPSLLDKKTLQTYSELRFWETHTGKQADTMKADVLQIVTKYGAQETDLGAITASESARYPIPTLEQWKTRLDSMTPEERVSAEKYTAELHRFHAWKNWESEMVDYFKAAGVIQKAATPTVRFVAKPQAPEATVPGKPSFLA